MRVLALGCILLSCCHALMIRRVLIPSNAQPGYIVTSLTYWGQQFTVDNSIRKDISRYFTVSSTGDLITSSDISDLVGSRLSLVINNILATEKWQDAVHVEILDGDQMLVFSRNSYSGFILENKPEGSPVKGLEDIQASIRKEPSKKVIYSISNGSKDSFALKVKVVQGETRIQVVTKKALDREQKAKYILTIRAKSEDGSYEAAYARVTIVVGDENDNIPKFEKSRYFTTISDDFPALATVVHVKAVDPDDGKIKYIMQPHELFKIDPQKGNIILKSRKHLDGQSYELVVYAEDQGGKQSEPVTVLIEVEDLHEHGSPLLFRQQQSQLHSHSRHKRDTQVLPTKEFEVPESMVGVLIRLSEGERYERFAFQPPAPGKLEINRYNGAVKLKEKKRLDYENQEDLNFTVIITRENDPAGKFKFF